MAESTTLVMYYFQVDAMLMFVLTSYVLLFRTNVRVLGDLASRQAGQLRSRSITTATTEHGYSRIMCVYGLSR